MLRPSNMSQDALSTVSLLLMLLLRSFIHKPIFKCFIHTLRDINPTLAKQVCVRHRRQPTKRYLYSKFTSNRVVLEEQR